SDSGIAAAKAAFWTRSAAFIPSAILDTRGSPSDFRPGFQGWSRHWQARRVLRRKICHCRSATLGSRGIKL
ncbi:MAG: hypothetical protein ACKOUT_15865, partial [Novosphingobium sp.]